MITVNGETTEHTPDMTVKLLLQRKNFIFPLLIVKIDGIYVPREAYHNTTIPDRAVVDVIHLISGG
jgi:thiamine biosynthesis protein ThiS